MKMFDAGKTRMIGLPYGKKNYHNIRRFHTILEPNGRTDRQICYINIVRHYAMSDGICNNNSSHVSSQYLKKIFVPLLFRFVLIEFWNCGKHSLYRLCIAA